MIHERVVYFNGQFVPEAEARVSVYDSALIYGDMAFETTRTYRHRPFRLRDHLRRLWCSLRLLEIDCRLSLDELEAATLETLEHNLSSEPADMDWQIVNNVSRGPLDFYGSAFELRPTVAIACWPLIVQMGRFAESYDRGIHVFVPAQQAIPAHLLDAKAKTRSRLHYQMANLQARRLGQGRWPLMLDTDGFLAEGPGWNVFLVKDGVLYTPEPRNVLRGVSRATTIELARELDIAVVETNLGCYEGLAADEMFCTATSFALVHAATFEGQLIADGKPGRIFSKLLEAWKRKAGTDFVAQAHDYAARLSDWERRQRIAH